MSDPAAVVDVSSWVPEEEEQLGARDKVWMRDGRGDDAVWWLFKKPRSTGLPEIGADLWAEVLASCVAALLPVPAAEARFASWDSEHGVISHRVGGTLVHGNELLWLRNDQYERGRLGPVPGYDLDSIAEVLHDYVGSEPGLSAFDSFAGYLMFDALIGNTDRHHENWAVVDAERSLAPTYDHGASLGFNVPREKRLLVVEVAGRGSARHFPGKPDLVTLARQSLQRVDVSVRDLWLGRVDGLDEKDVQAAVAAVPEGWMSEGARTFVVDFIATNRRRLLR